MRHYILSLLRVMITSVILFTTFVAYGFYQEYPARSFCNHTDDKSLPIDVINSAKAQGLPVADYMEERNEIWVFNHKEPFFRAACEIKFNDDGVLSKAIIGAD